MGDGSGVLVRVHEKELEVGEVVDEDLLVARGDQVAGLLVRAVTDLGHGELALEATTNLAKSAIALGDVLKERKMPGLWSQDAGWERSEASAS